MPQCTRIGFQLGPDDDLDAFEKQTAAHGLRTSRKKDPEPTINDMVAFEDPKGTVMEVFKRPEPQSQGFRSTGIVPHKLGHVAFHVTDVKARHTLLLRRSGLPRVGLDGRLLLVPALRCGSSHHQSGRDRQEQAFSHGVRAARLGAYPERLRFPEQERLQDSLGSRAVTASATISSPIIAARTG